MSTPDDEVTLCRDECTFDRAALPLPLEVRLATSWSRSEPRAPSSLSPRLSLPSRFCISYRPLLSTVAVIMPSGKSEDDERDATRYNRRETTDTTRHSPQFPQAEKGTRGRGVHRCRARKGRTHGWRRQESGKGGGRGGEREREREGGWLADCQSSTDDATSRGSIPHASLTSQARTILSFSLTERCLGTIDDT
ncbi:hypothetical protein ALC56_07419 [Trachymyrmex septentrionalis]|uniref:Uncharacterized protein n=1 Tax=Trachymyrmex septentrionalis TaxID=34720 RepID=A0A195FED0_9HYME|nr:hypothetical protein ALC56_07419 [Trachymyrmex septentrionalis]